MSDENISKLLAGIEARISDFVQNKAPTIIKVEALNFILHNFRQQGFTDKGLEKWKKRKVPDSSNKRKSAKKAKKSDAGRAILVGNNNRTQGGHLKDSFTGSSYPGGATIASDKPYAAVHNFGGSAGRGSGFEMPQRQMIGESEYLEKKISDKLNAARTTSFVISCP